MTKQAELFGHPLAVRHFKRARCMRLSLDVRNGGFKLSLPKNVSLKKGLEWALTQEAWVRQSLVNKPAAQPIVNGMHLIVAGAPLVICYDRTAKPLPKRVGNQLWVGGAESELAGRVLRWLKRESLALLTQETQAMAARGQLSVVGVAIGDAKSRWGSCSSTGIIRYNWRLILAPNTVRRAIVAHEVAHRRHMNHSPAFHQLAAELYGENPRAAYAWLKKEGRALHSFGML